jgi:quercetin dioxygenase-like cupin family protein
MSFNIVISLIDNEHFFNYGFTKPKYYLPMANGKTMIENSIDNLITYGEITVLVQKDESNKYKLDKFIKEKYDTISIIYIESHLSNILKDIDIHFKNNNSLLITRYDELYDYSSDIFKLKENSIGWYINNTFFWKTVSDFYNYTNTMYEVLEKKDMYHFYFKTPTQYYEYLQNNFGSVKNNKLDNMTRGWLIGNFEPSILKTDTFEVGYLKHPKGELWPPHVHKEVNEYNILIKGKMIINNEIIEQGEIFIIPKNMLTSAKFLEDCEILCIKVPSNTKDKYCY